MMIVALTAQGASFFHVRAAYPRSAETVKSSKSSHSQKRCRPPLAIAGRSAVSPERRRSVAKKVFLRAACSRLFFVSIPMRVDRGIDREETAVAAVSERYRGDNVFRVKPSRQLVAPRRLSADSLSFASMKIFFAVKSRMISHIRNV